MTFRGTTVISQDARGYVTAKRLTNGFIRRAWGSDKQTPLSIPDSERAPPARSTPSPHRALPARLPPVAEMGFVSFVGRVLFVSVFLLSAYQE